jgi:ElaB protein
MESKKNLPSERDKTPGGVSESSPTSGQTRATGGQASAQTTGTSTAPQRARELGNEVSSSAQQVYDQTRQAVSNAYEKTSETLSNTYDQAMSYGREHPGQLTLIAFGAGIGIGLLLASGFSGGRSRSTRIIEPVGNALTQIAMELFRR